MKIQSRQENVIYLALWGILFAAPVLSMYVRTVSDSMLTFNWSEIFIVWRLFAVYLILFLIHNFLLAPMLIYGRKRMLYSTIMVALFAGFITYQCTHRPQFMERKHFPMEQRMGHGNDPDRGPDELRGRHDPRMMNHDRQRPPREFRRFRQRPPAFMGEHDIVAVVVLFLMFGMNIGVKLFFKNRNDQKKLDALQKKNLEQQLEYLKYQINPHFFMNTLNNIHALVDIDPEKAKDTILELSKMMRFILYEGDKSGVPLTREFDFIRHYIALMQLRYTNKVDIVVDLPDEAPDKTVPPLMLISFIENAFKHGISYQHPSFVHIKIAISNEPLAIGQMPKANSQKLIFSCRNSKAEKPNQEKGGVGLTNVKQRLHLLYDNNYTLKIQNEPESYNVELTIPLT